MTDPFLSTERRPLRNEGHMQGTKDSGGLEEAKKGGVRKRSAGKSRCPAYSSVP